MAGHDDDLPHRLDRLAARGAPRGADEVLHAARAAASSAGVRRAGVSAAVSVVLAVAVMGGAVGVALTRDGDGDDTGAVAAPPAAEGRRPAGAGAPLTPLTPRLVAASRLEPFGSCDALVDWVREHAPREPVPIEDGGAAGGAGGVAGAVPGDDVAADAAGAPAATRSQAGDGDAAFSTTNVQEAGVDEPDTVKTDGRRIYTLANGRLWVLDATAAPPTVLGSLPLADASTLLLAGDRVVALGGGGNFIAADVVRPGGSWSGDATITVVDVSDPARLAVRSTMRVDGSYVAARLVDGLARVVVSSAPGGPVLYDAPMARAGGSGPPPALTVDDILPSYTLLDGVGRVAASGRLVECDDVYRPPAFSGLGTVTVLTVDPDDPAGGGRTAVVASAEQVYASASRLYVATSRWEPSELVSHTLVHAFDITGDDGARYLVSGQVAGAVLNQFSFSEHAGHLRVATTEERGDGASESAVTVLADDGRALVPVGRVGGLGRGERIFAVRYIGDVGYVVTFRQTDPLYTVDLSDPARPRVVGELKIPGYSAYLHPIADGLLLGVGQDADDQGRVRGTQVSVFDVSDPAAPRRLHQRVLGTGQSAAEFDHRAFLWWAPARLAVLPVHDDRSRFSGAVGLRAGVDILEEVGRVAHPVSAHDRYPIERSLVVGDRLYTVSAAGVLASDVASLAERGWVPLR